MEGTRHRREERVRVTGPMVHWVVWISVPGGQFMPMTGCMKWPGELTEHPEQVTCTRCKALPSYRSAIGLVAV